MKFAADCKYPLFLKRFRYHRCIGFFEILAVVSVKLTRAFNFLFFIRMVLRTAAFTVYP